MVSILFVCHGNICRSPMAEFVMKDIVKKRGLEQQFHIESRGTSTEELGNPVYPPVKAELAKHGISCKGKVAIQLRKEDYKTFDWLIVMDDMNLRNAAYITGGDPEHKIHKMLTHVRPGAEVSDPWYTRRFGDTYRDVLAGCESWLAFLDKENAQKR